MSKITIDRAVLEQALEALFMYRPMVAGVTFQHGLDAMQALRAALEQPQGEQEPVAVAVGIRWRWPGYDWNYEGYDEKATWANDVEKEHLYTSPPASKPWVGLTNSDKLDLISAAKGIGGRIQGDGQLLALLDEHEAKLREKNA